MILKFLFLLILHGFLQGFLCSTSAFIPSGTQVLHRRLEDSSTCPLDIAKLRKILAKYAVPLRFIEIQLECKFQLEAFRIIRADYLLKTGYFTFPANESEPCWEAFESLVNDYIKSFPVRATCGVQTQWISDSCLNISTKSQFEALIPESQLQEVKTLCNQSLTDRSSCDPCVASLSRIESDYFDDVPEAGNVSDCKGFPFMYGAAFANQFGPTDIGTMRCLFALFNSSDPTIAEVHHKHKTVIRGVIVVSVNAVLVAILLIWLLWRRQKNQQWKETDHLENAVTFKASSFEILGEGITLVRFNLDELKQATRNFSRENLIGKGGFGNVYKGVLGDGSEVALKRFKNCSVSGDETFTHEVEVIASVRHVNLVALRGYCTATTPLEGHQRIIVCDLIRNGSLHDHLFSSMAERLSWPVRRKIIKGIARGLAYLHNGVQPAIIHRDIKASNILIDESFEPKLADFGLAKFTPDGFSHVSTRVAGTLGYTCPEYALYGQLTEKSDVYSFGVVLLELLSGKKAVISFSNDKAVLLTDWAWSLVKEGRGLDIIEENMPDIDPSGVMEKHVLAAILSVHPVLHARPTMNQIVNILESENEMVYSSPDLAFPSAAEIVETERLLSFSDLSSMFSSTDQHQSSSQDYSFVTREGREEIVSRNSM